METNIIYNRDCIEGMKELPDDSIDCIVTDPAYKTTSRGNAGNAGGMLQKDINIKGQVFKHNDIKIEDWIYDLYRVLKESGHCYIMTNHKNLKKYLNVIEDAGFHFIKSLIWNKNNKIMGQYYMSQFEYILFLRKGRGVQINNCGTSDILNVPNNKTKNENGENIHDTEKPVNLMKILIENSSQPEDIVLDPFMGSGTTAIASKISNRKFIGYEIDKKYYKICYKRLGSIDKKYYNHLPEEEKPAQKQLF